MPDTFLAETEITADIVSLICRAARIKTEPSTLCDFFAYPYALKTFVTVNTENQRLDLRAYYQIDSSQPRLALLEMINQLNQEYLAARFYLLDNDTLACASSIPFDGGVTPYFIVTALQFFSQSVAAATSESYTDNLII